MWSGTWYNPQRRSTFNCWHSTSGNTLFLDQKYVSRGKKCHPPAIHPTCRAAESCAKGRPLSNSMVHWPSRHIDLGTPENPLTNQEAPTFPCLPCGDQVNKKRNPKLLFSEIWDLNSSHTIDIYTVLWVLCHGSSLFFWRRHCLPVTNRIRSW